MYDQLDIIKLLAGLADTLAYGQCMAGKAASYIGVKITQLPVMLEGTPM